MPSMLLGTLEMEGFGTVMLDNGIWDDFDMENCCHGNATDQMKGSRKAAEAVGRATAASYLAVGGCGGVVGEGDVGGAVVLLFAVTHALFRTLEVLPELHDLLKETEAEREE